MTTAPPPPPSPVASYDAATAALCRANLADAARTAQRLRASLARTAALFPLTGAALAAADEAALERLDALRVRFSDLHDLLATKVFRGILLPEEERPGTQLDMLNAMEKRGIIPSFATWKELREVRNAFTHEYPADANERAEALTLAVASAGTLLGVLARAGDYLQRRLGPPGAPAGDPE